MRKFPITSLLFLSLCFGSTFYLLTSHPDRLPEKKSSLDVAESIIEKVRRKREAVAKLYSGTEGQPVYSTLTHSIEATVAGLFNPSSGDGSFSIIAQQKGKYVKIFQTRAIAVDSESEYLVEWSIQPLESQEISFNLYDDVRIFQKKLSSDGGKNAHYFKPNTDRLLIELHLEATSRVIEPAPLARVNFINVIKLK